MTASETVLWEELRNRKLGGYKFLRQHPIVYNPNGSGSKYFVADFYCVLKKTVLEIDGPIHEANVELLDIPAVLTKIETYLKSIK